MYDMFTYIYHKNQLNVGKYTIHGSYGKWKDSLPTFLQGFGNPQPRCNNQWAALDDSLRLYTIHSIQKRFFEIVSK